MKFLSLLLFSLIAYSDLSQIQIIDAKLKEPVSYAHIQSVDGTKVLFSDYYGFFTLASSFQGADSILISCIGYEQKTSLVSDILKEKVIELDPSTEHLSELIVKAKKTKSRMRTLGITKKPKEKTLSDHIGRGKNGEERALWIPNEYSVPGYLKNINVYVLDAAYPDAHFRVHVYDCDPLETKPTEELTKSNIIASATKGNEWVSIDMTKEQIQLGENGCFIGIEWFDSPKSKFYRDTVFLKGYDSDGQDTVYARVSQGNGAVLGGVFEKFRYARNKLWKRESDTWKSRNLPQSLMYTSDTLPNGSVFHRTPDNQYLGLMCINIDVSFPKGKIDLSFREPKKRKLNKLEKVKQDVFKYPQSTIQELFSSLIEAFEQQDIIYVLKYLCVYEKNQLGQMLNYLDKEEYEEFISPEDYDSIIKYLKDLQSRLDSASVDKMDNKHFKLILKDEHYNLVVEDGLWKINPYSYRIHKLD